LHGCTVANGIEPFGFCNPVLIDNQGEIIAGVAISKARVSLGRNPI
jgi:hypothetical protein